MGGLFQPRDESVHARVEQRVGADPVAVGDGDRRRVGLQALEGGDVEARRWPSATISPLAPSRTSSRLAGRSDSSGMQPWPIASSTETDTESLRGTLTYQRARA